MKAYVIKRDDGKYYCKYDSKFTNNIYLAKILVDKDYADCLMYLEKFKHNCKVVPVEIKECEDE